MKISIIGILGVLLFNVAVQYLVIGLILELQKWPNAMIILAIFIGYLCGVISFVGYAIWTERSEI
jgi:hypothetical protein